ncbi:hypothetical protein SAMN05660642_03987 [Geodermatophilus siccatus]|uniref:Uncharacterized protein n=1 Tax=Geodermatophilus siccatus TaxID=1137991 RepID=A0A1G9YCD0_9ACTN|nr:hypothetical protein [Geodermatophilus siccatus]SDN06764.1 hypothetical protein SAMN05660642_03987 [Geodermatophilus siccatus]
MSASTTTTFTARPLHTGPRPCSKHTACRWLAYCDDCTAWHLGRQIAAREAARTRTAPVLALVRSTDRRPARLLRLAA